MAGEREVKASGVLFLPQLSGQDTNEYLAYKLRAQFFNATGRTVDSFVGMIFSKDPEMEFPEELENFDDDCSLQGQSFYDYIKNAVRDVISVGRAGTLIDWNEPEARPYCAYYPAEQIINWRTSRINGKQMLSLVVLKELVDASEDVGETVNDETADAMVSPSTLAIAQGPGFVATATTGTFQLPPPSGVGDVFQTVLVDQYRVLRMVQQADGSFAYMVELWRKGSAKKQNAGATASNNGADWQKIKEITPTRLGQALTAIPFVFHGPNNTLPTVDKSPVQDIVDINLSHYRTSADLEHGRHFTGLPMAFIAGIEAKDTFRIGSENIITTPQADASASYLEFSGEGLKSLERALEQKEHHMAVLGARMLEQEKKGVETLQVVEIKQTGEQASLAQIAHTMSEGFELVVRWALWWLSSADIEFVDTEEEVCVELNDQFNPASIDPALVAAIVAAGQAGYLSTDSVITKLKAANLVSPMRTVEEEIDMIATEGGGTLKGRPLNTDQMEDPAKKQQQQPPAEE